MHEQEKKQSPVMTFFLPCNEPFAQLYNIYSLETLASVRIVLKYHH